MAKSAKNNADQQLNYQWNAYIQCSLIENLKSQTWWSRLDVVEAQTTVTRASLLEAECRPTNGSDMGVRATYADVHGIVLGRLSDGDLGSCLWCKVGPGVSWYLWDFFLRERDVHVRHLWNYLTTLFPLHMMISFQFSSHNSGSVIWLPYFRNSMIVGIPCGHPVIDYFLNCRTFDCTVWILPILDLCPLFFFSDPLILVQYLTIVSLVCKERD
jgi:hypothetical protein